MENPRGQTDLLHKLKDLGKVAGDKSLNRIAYGCGLVVESQFKRNIQAEPSKRAGVPHRGLIDTGFMLNACYTIGPDVNGALSAEAAATSKALRPFVVIDKPRTGQAITTNGAEYYANVHHGHHNTSGHPVLTRAAATCGPLLKDVAKMLAKEEIRKAVGH